MTKHVDRGPVLTDTKPHLDTPAPFADDTGQRSGPFAVVELFTSEGCSSCPPADELLRDIVREAKERDLPVFALGFHVDYWDFQGWPDRFATARHTARQTIYSASLGTGNLYTPQMVVNGVAEFVGSRRSHAWKAINAELAKPTETSIRASAERVVGDDQTLRVIYEVDGGPDGAVLNVAVVESGIEVKVLAGENAGWTLRHDNAVRVFDASPLESASGGEVELQLPADLVAENSSVIVYLQVGQTGRIIAAASVGVSPPTEPPPDGLGPRACRGRDLSSGRLARP